MENNIYLGLGSNIGNRIGYLRQAVHLVNESVNCEVIKASSVYESKPLSNLNHENYFNAVILIGTDFTPEKLLHFVKNIEIEIGRIKNEEKWAPREIDIDILFYNQLIYNGDDLKIPHPESLKRDFVVKPVIEIHKDFVHPVLKKKFSQIDFSKIESNIINKLDYSLL